MRRNFPHSIFKSVVVSGNLLRQGIFASDDLTFRLSRRQLEEMKQSCLKNNEGK
jgi:hypothetical protein